MNQSIIFVIINAMDPLHVKVCVRGGNVKQPIIINSFIAITLITTG